MTAAGTGNPRGMTAQQIALAVVASVVLAAIFLLIETPALF